MAKEPQLSPRRPYLLRAMHEWMTDNGQTPHLVVDAAVEGVVVPRQYVRDGKIVLNASYTATAGLQIKNDSVSFSARFSGTPFEVSVPVQAVLGIYARETGQGMIFSDDEPAAAQATASKPGGPTLIASGGGSGSATGRVSGDDSGGDKPRRPGLKVVK